ncbi:sce7726 family protein [Pectobacterium punjabense]|uniref:sce7726 family protein n=1 Tax=Pectobacterium punjabense TaxID=2108399 RepID=UPI002404D86E|nr:sce7726 family protein [Pectobacterium punjabense]MDG0798632.1 sce7726 family protein [Pectobacterium punjabense]
MKELAIKLKLIDFLVKNSSNELILGSEVRFNFGSRRADIVSLEEKIATVYEIKSAGDSIERLANQIDNYKEYFDYCYIVCVDENISSVRKKISKSIGIIKVSESSVIFIRKARKFIQHSKISLSSTLPLKLLKKNSINKNIKSKFELCLDISKRHKTDEIRLISREKLKESLENRYSLFLSEVGEIITPDDMLTLTRMPSGRISRLPQ